MSKCLIITGMGRSGTSLVANLIFKAGVDIGERFVAPGRANPRGYFEDVDFYQFHDRILQEHGHTIFVPAGFQFKPTASDYDQAGQLVAARADRAVWGWKDPRTSLFLDFWQRILPQASFIFVYRHPLDVLSSLLRSHILHNEGLLEAIDSWHTYNSRIKAFYERHPEQCILCHTSVLTERIGDFQKLLVARFGIDLPLDRELVQSIYHPEEFRQLYTSAEVAALLEAIHPQAAALYASLNTLADLPAVGQNGTAAPELAQLARFVESAPLSRAQARGVLLWLIDLTEPGTLEAFFQELQTRAQQSDSHASWLEEQCANLQKALENEQRLTRELRQQNQQLEQAKLWLDEQRANLQNALGQEQQLARELRQQNQQREHDQRWLEAQHANLQHALDNEQQIAHELRQQNQQLEQAKVWLEAQHANLQSALGQEQQIAHELRQQNQQLEQAKVWLEVQLGNLQNALQNEQQIVHELRSWNQQLEHAKVWLEQQCAAWQEKAERLEAETSALHQT